MANKYQIAFFKLFKRQTLVIQAKINAAKVIPDTKDKDVALFVRQVCELAEDGIIRSEPTT
jgi:hypothetical protein